MTPTPGMKSSEFWASVLGSLAVVFNERLSLNLTPDAMYTLAVLLGGYVLSRGVAKGRAK